MRPPAVAGVAGGVGTTTLALALCGRDTGQVDAADVLACRATVDSLRRVAAVLERTGDGPRPVLAVTLDGARLPRGPVRARLRLLEPEVSAVVLLPHVRPWRTADDPSAQAATVLVDPIERVPWPLQAYATAVHDLAAALVASGRLEIPAGRADAAAPPDRPVRATNPVVADGRPRAVAVPRVVGAARPVAAASSPGAARQRGVRIVVPAPPPVVSPPVRDATGRHTLPGGTAGPADRAEQAG